MFSPPYTPLHSMHKNAQSCKTCAAGLMLRSGEEMKVKVLRLKSPTLFELPELSCDRSQEFEN